jgi:hypothetical protein
VGYTRALVSSTRYETQGISGGVGATVTAPATANTKGSFSTLGTTGFEYDGFHLTITGLPGAGTGRFRIDVSSNTGGSDQLIVEDLYFDASPAGIYAADQKSILVPVAVPAGAVLKARAQATAASLALSVGILGFQGDAKATKGFRALKSATDWTNTDPTNALTLSGTTLTGWTQIMAATPVRLAGLYLELDSLGSAGTTSHATFEIGIGASGSEHSTGIVVARQLVSGGALVTCHGPYPCDIAAGTRLTVRAQCDAANTNSYGIVLNGLAA